MPGQVIQTSYFAPESGYTGEPVLAVPIAEPLGSGVAGDASDAAVTAAVGGDGFPAYDPAAFERGTAKQPSAPPAPLGY